jgi:hypothetical protein
VEIDELDEELDDEWLLLLELLDESDRDEQLLDELELLDSSSWNSVRFSVTPNAQAWLATRVHSP